MTDDARQYAPATKRNREAILEVLQQVVPYNCTVLEIASGTGEHGVFFAPRMGNRKWLPSEPNPLLLASIEAWQTYQPVDNLYPPLELDVCDSVWPIETRVSPTWLQSLDFETFPLAAMVNINMIHIAPWLTCLGIMAGASRILPPGGILYMYGPFKQDGKHTAPSNAAFDATLRSQNPQWGVRDLNDVVEVARARDLSLLTTYQMPANNLSVVFQRQ